MYACIQIRKLYFHNFLIATFIGWPMITLAMFWWKETLIWKETLTGLCYSASMLELNNCKRNITDIDEPLIWHSSVFHLSPSCISLFEPKTIGEKGESVLWRQKINIKAETLLDKMEGRDSLASKAEYQNQLHDGFHML